MTRRAPPALTDEKAPLARLLLVGDDPALLERLRAELAASGYELDRADSGERAVAAALASPHALILLDLGLASRSGFGLLRGLRRRGIATPIVILTARDAPDDGMKGLDLGADDYLPKPFETRELQARIRALLRRSQGAFGPVIRIGSLVIDRSRAIASINGRRLELRRREWSLLERLAAKAGSIVSKEMLAREIFGSDDAVAPNAVELYVGRLRKKLGAGGPVIRTVRRLGYVLDSG
ncbi:MAG: two-component system, OmpR family, response regulator TctD [Sphingomonadales bacterium]|jgi:two-component system response regulator TctD|nr:two-component system, OmpR family, response regulator TctD [Sphingomonadales bacterium]